MGDYSRRLDRYTNVSTAQQIAAADTGTKTPIALVAGETIYIQKIEVSVFTDAAQTLTFQDNAGTPIVIGKTKSSPGLGPILFDFGPEGYPLTEAKQFDVVISGAGLGAALFITAYRKRTATGAA